MRLTILGNNGPYPAAGGACSGYLLEEGKKKILIDLGNGVLSNLQKFVSFEELDAIILTHLHSDHMSDLMVLRYAWMIKMGKGQIDRKMKVYAPNEPIEEYARINVKEIFDITQISEKLELEFDSLRVTFKTMKHPYKCYAVCFDNGQKRFVFSGDTAFHQGIIDFSKNADVIMLDSGLISKDKKDENVVHLTAKECGQIAAYAAVKKLILTHFFPEYDIKDLLEEAKHEFENTITAELLRVYEI